MSSFFLMCILGPGKIPKETKTKNNNREKQKGRNLENNVFSQRIVIKSSTWPQETENNTKNAQDRQNGTCSTKVKI